MDYREITAPQDKSDACHATTLTLPDWFGRPDANAMYRAQIIDKDVFAAYDDGQPVGMIALRYHFETTAEIWWMGVMRTYHRQGIGRRLMALALDRGRQRGCSYAALMTLGPESADEGYAATRSFYAAHGFQPFVHIADDDPHNSMMWMMRDL